MVLGWTDVEWQQAWHNLEWTWGKSRPGFVWNGVESVGIGLW